MPTIEDIRTRFSMDGAVKQSLRSHGDDESKEHAIEHHFIAESPAPLQQLGGCAKALGFEVAPISDGAHKGEAYSYFDVVSRHDTTMPSIIRESILMAALAEAFGATYDGWGTLIEK